MAAVNGYQCGAGILKICGRSVGNCLRRAMGVQHAAGVLPQNHKSGSFVAGIAVGRTTGGNQQGFGQVGAVGEVPALGIVGHDNRVQGEIAFDKGTGLLPGGTGAYGGRQNQGEASFAGAELGGRGGHEGSAESGGCRRLPRLEAAGKFVLQLASVGDGQAAEQQIAAHGTGEGRVHNRQVEVGQRGDFFLFRAPGTAAVHPAGIANRATTDAHAGGRQGELNRGLRLPQEVKRAQGYVVAVGSERHDVEVDAVKLDVGVQHGQTGGGEVHGGELNVVAVQGLFHHRLVQGRGIPASGFGVAAFGFGGYGHQQGAGAAGDVGYVEGRGELVVAPVNASRPVVEHQPGEQRCRRHGGVIGAGELGVG